MEAASSKSTETLGRGGGLGRGRGRGNRKPQIPKAKAKAAGPKTKKVDRDLKAGGTAKTKQHDFRVGPAHRPVFKFHVQGPAPEPNVTQDFDGFRVKHCPQSGRPANYIRFLELPGTKPFFLVSEKQAGTIQRAWEVSLGLAHRLVAGTLTRDSLPAARDEIFNT